MKIPVIYVLNSASAVMIVCSCNIIVRREIEAVIEDILSDDPYAILTPGLLYHRLGRRGKCCGCFPHVSRILVEHGMLVRAQIEDGSLELTEDEPEEKRSTAA